MMVYGRSIKKTKSHIVERYICVTVPSIDMIIVKYSDKILWWK